MPYHGKPLGHMPRDAMPFPAASTLAQRVLSALHLFYVVDCTRVLRLLQSFGLPESLPYPVTGEAIVILGEAPLPVTKSSYLQTMSKTAHHLHL